MKLTGFYLDNWPSWKSMESSGLSVRWASVLVAVLSLTIAPKASAEKACYVSTAQVAAAAVKDPRFGPILNLLRARNFAGGVTVPIMGTINTTAEIGDDATGHLTMHIHVEPTWVSRAVDITDPGAVCLNDNKIELVNARTLQAEGGFKIDGLNVQFDHKGNHFNLNAVPDKTLAAQTNPRLRPGVTQ